LRGGLHQTAHLGFTLWCDLLRLWRRAETRTHLTS